MQWKNTTQQFGALAKFFHWTCAIAFVGAYFVVYYVIWFMDDSSPESLPVLNIHWILGIFVGACVLPRLLWRMLNIHPEELPLSAAEKRLAKSAHWGLYGLMVLMPLTGYIGTDADTDFGLFKMPSFRETMLFGWIQRTFGTSWEAFEPPVDIVHHFVGKWIAWLVVALHIAAALFHHLVRGDDTLERMLPQSLTTGEDK